MVKNINSKQGFTVIEVVLVLAIAGLIFLMVFIALPNLQRSQRDSQRRNDYTALASSVSSIISNNSGRYPKAGSTLTSKEKVFEKNEPSIINKDGKAPNNAYYSAIVVEAKEGGGFNPAAYDEDTLSPTLGDPNKDDDPSIIYVVTHANCNGDKDGLAFPAFTNSARAFAVYGALEGSTYCQAVNDAETYKE